MVDTSTPASDEEMEDNRITALNYDKMVMDDEANLVKTLSQNSAYPSTCIPVAIPTHVSRDSVRENIFPFGTNALTDLFIASFVCAEKEWAIIYSASGVIYGLYRVSNCS